MLNSLLKFKKVSNATHLKPTEGTLRTNHVAAKRDRTEESDGDADDDVAYVSKGARGKPPTVAEQRAAILNTTLRNEKKAALAAAGFSDEQIDGVLAPAANRSFVGGGAAGSSSIHFGFGSRKVPEASAATCPASTKAVPQSKDRGGSSDSGSDLDGSDVDGEDGEGEGEGYRRRKKAPRVEANAAADKPTAPHKKAPFSVMEAEHRPRRPHETARFNRNIQRFAVREIHPRTKADLKYQQPPKRGQ